MWYGPGVAVMNPSQNSETDPDAGEREGDATDISDAVVSRVRQGHRDAGHERGEGQRAKGNDLGE
jgi:hypothetical protein